MNFIILISFQCTSAVSADVEAKIYETCHQLGITIFTVSHRPQLKHHHDYEFHFDGEGGWTFTALHPEKEKDNEKAAETEIKKD